LTHDEVAGVCNHSSRTESRTITLRSTPSTSERCKVDFELGLSKTSGTKTATGVVDSLQVGLGTDILLDKRLQRLVASNELIHKCLEHESRITGPGVEVLVDVRDGSYRIRCYESLTVRVGLRRRSNHNTSTSTRSLGATGTDVVEDPLQSNSVLRREPRGERTSSTLLNVLGRGKSESSSKEHRKGGKETHDEKSCAVDDGFVQTEE
jgi:hypothetical protein